MKEHKSDPSALSNLIDSGASSRLLEQEKEEKTLLTVLQSIDLSKLTDEERWRIEHQRLHEKHRGHESMHAEMVLILISTLIIAQILLVQWKQRHFRTYQVRFILCT